jgi:hypothetical protein
MSRHNATEVSPTRPVWFARVPVFSDAQQRKVGDSASALAKTERRGGVAKKKAAARYSMNRLFCWPTGTELSTRRDRRMARAAPPNVGSTRAFRRQAALERFTSASLRSSKAR